MFRRTLSFCRCCSPSFVTDPVFFFFQRLGVLKLAPTLGFMVTSTPPLGHTPILMDAPTTVTQAVCSSLTCFFYFYFFSFIFIFHFLFFIFHFLFFIFYFLFLFFIFVFYFLISVYQTTDYCGTGRSGKMDQCAQDEYTLLPRKVQVLSSN